MTTIKSLGFTVPLAWQIARSRWYNPALQLIMLNGPRGPIVCRYVSTEIVPNPDIHQFEVEYEEAYQPYTQPYVPQFMLPSINATARALLKRPRSGTAALAAGLGELQTIPVPHNGEDMLLTPLGVSDPFTTGAIRITPEAVVLQGSNGGLVIDELGLRTTGHVQIGSNIERGATIEGPGFSVIPKSFFTFPVADNIPAVHWLMKLAVLMSYVYKVGDTANKVYEFVRNRL